MKQYSHDYTKPKKAEQLLHEVQVEMRWQNHYQAQQKINEARQLLQEYLAQDNMVEDDDVVDGWVKANDTFSDDQLEDIRDEFVEALERLKGSKSDDDSISRAIKGVSQNRLEIINVCQRNLCCDEYNSVDEFWNEEPGIWNERRRDDYGK